MNEVEKAKHDAAIKLQRFVNTRIASGEKIQIHDTEALAVIEAISYCVIKSIEHYLAQPLEKTGNGN